MTQPADNDTSSGPLTPIATILDSVPDRGPFDRFFDLSNDMLGVASFNGTMLHVNSAWSLCLGWAREELVGKPYLVFVHPDDHNIANAALATLRRGEVAAPVEWRNLCKDGSYRWLQWSNYPSIKTQQIFSVVRDITLSRDTDARLRLLESCVARMNDMVVISGIDRHGLPWPGIVYVNDAFVRQTGYSRQDVIGKTLQMLEGPKTQRDAVRTIDVAMQQLQPVRVEILNYTKAGAEMWVEIDKVPVADDQGVFTHWVSIERDISARKRTEQRLTRSESLLAKAEELSGTGSWDWDLTGGESFWSDGLYAIYGRNKSEGVPAFDAWKETIHPDDIDTIGAYIESALKIKRKYATEFRIHAKNTGELRYIASRGESVQDEAGNILRIRGVDQDVTARMLTQQALEAANAEMAHSNARLESIAHYDALTLLPNRVLLADRLQLAMVQSQRRGQLLAVAFLDLDGFKSVNDNHGHNVGDQLLIALALRMKEALREGDSLARLGGDEFVAVMADLNDASDCTPMLERLLRAAADPVSIGNVAFQLSASIGVTLYPQDNADADLLMRHADQAMYLAKQAGKNRFHMFDIAQDAAVQSQREHLDHISLGLDKDEFVLHFQPKVNMRSGTVIGAEALIRWQHPQRGLLPPAAFLPLIGEHPVSIRLGEWVIGAALRQMERWQASGLTMTVSVNIAANHLQQDGFALRLGELLAEHPTIAPQSLELEVLETSALEDIQRVSQIMRDCQALGVRFALDDFGTGYSSLTYLKRLPAEMLKIDQSFVRDMLADPDDLAIVQGVIGLATAFRREVIAEGVETVAHGQSLLGLGCHFAQGYGIARPMPGSEIPQWVANWRPDAAWADEVVRSGA